MENRERNRQLKIYLSEEEKELFNEKMKHYEIGRASCRERV